MTRVLESALEGHLHEQIGVGYPCLPWLVEHTGGLLARGLFGEGGKTGFERSRGRKWKAGTIEFGEAVLVLIGKPCPEESRGNGAQME